MKRIFTLILFFLVVLFLLYRSLVFLDGPTAVKDWNRLCKVEDCSQFPDLHMTYEVDNRRYYFPAWPYKTKPEQNLIPNLFGVLPMGVQSRKTWVRPTFRHSHSKRSNIYVDWKVLDFDMYLETRADDTIRRGFGRIGEDTEIERFGRGVLDRLPEYFDIDTSHPSGPLREFNFYLHSKDSSLDDFNLNSQLMKFRRRAASREVVGPKTFVWPRTSAELRKASFESFNGAFWIVSDTRNAKVHFPHLAVVSKFPILHGRHVLGICRATCRFSSLKLLDDPQMGEPLAKVEMNGADINAFHPSCYAKSNEPTCDPSMVNFENMRLRFSVVEQVVEALRDPPTAHVE